MNVIPAIDLLEGRCVRLYQGDYEKQEVFDADPVAVARRWAAAGATRLHAVDLDGAKAGRPVNASAIAAIVAALPDVEVEVGGGLRDRDSVAALLDSGARYAILGTVAVENPDLVGALCEEFPDRIIVGIDARNGKVATRGWLETSEIDATDLAARTAALGVAELIYTDIHRDGTLSGPNIDALRELASAVAIPVIASGGIGSMTHLLGLLRLEGYGVTGAIVGRALYTGAIDLKEALQAIGPGRLQDVPLDFGSSTWA